MPVSNSWRSAVLVLNAVVLVLRNGLAYITGNVRKKGSCLEKETMQGTMSGARRRGRPRTAWMDNIKTWTGLSVEESVRMTKDRDKWRKSSMVWPTVGSRTAKEQNRTEGGEGDVQPAGRATVRLCLASSFHCYMLRCVADGRCLPGTKTMGSSST